MEFGTVKWSDTYMVTHQAVKAREAEPKVAPKAYGTCICSDTDTCLMHAFGRGKVYRVVHRVTNDVVGEFTTMQDAYDLRFLVGSSYYITDAA